MPRINQPTAIKSTQLTAAGVADNIADTKGANSLSCEFVVAAINTNVIVRLEFSNDRAFASGVYFTPELTITANGNYAISSAPVKRYCRARFVSEAGGTAATVDVNMNIFN
jgi:hypothetical protein